MTRTPAPKGQDIELAPCPFCGGEAQTDFIEGESYLIECYACRAETGIKDSEDEAIEAWNRRTEPSSTSTSQVAGIDPWPLADALYERGYRDAQNERDYDPRAGEEWHTVVDAIAGAAPGDALDARFHFDHGVWHDRVTGQHMWTQDQYDEAVRDARNGGPLPKVATSAESLVNVWNDALEEAAKICEQQANEPECPERASYCADEIRALKSCSAIATSTAQGES